MNKLYIITGPAGVGKSTISKSIAENLNKSVLIEGDDIYHQVIGGYTPAWKDGNHLEVFWNVCINMINNYLSFGYDVVFNYIINDSKIKELQEYFQDVNINFKVLLSSEDTLLKRDIERPIDCRMNERCLVLLEKFKNYNFNNDDIIYTDNLNVEQITNIILKNK